MKPIHPYISVTIILASLLCLPLSSCESDADAPSPTSKMSVSFRVETRNGEQTNAGDNTANETSTGTYKAATEWENYINIAKGDYRIGFFDVENNCITPFAPDKIKAVEGTNYTEYTLEGKVPSILTFYSDFKIVVLANWGNNYPAMLAGTALEDICCPGGNERVGQFKYFDNANGYGIPATSTDETRAEGEEPRYVPMYGIKEYTGVQFGVDNNNNPTVAYEGNFGPINMLRAIAKVEVVFNTEDPYTLDNKSNIYITNYNEYGYCAPEAYSEDAYSHNGNWNLDYWQGHLHLVGGRNDSGEKPLAMTKMTKDGKDVWVAYLPEYRNVASTNTDCGELTPASEGEITRARIAVPLKRGDDSYTSYIEFAKYTNGEPTDRLNIERNNLYRFTITNVDPGVKWKVEALPWKCLEHPTIVM